MTITITDDTGKVVFTGVANERTFSTGSTGYSWQTKMIVDGKKHQLSANLILIGSKPKEPREPV